MTDEEKKRDPNSNLRLSLEKVEDIRRNAGKMSDADLARRHGVHPNSIRLVKQNKTWVDPNYKPVLRKVRCVHCRGTGRVDPDTPQQEAAPRDRTLDDAIKHAILTEVARFMKRLSEIRAGEGALISPEHEEGT